MSSDQETEIVLTTINAKWIHPSLALRLLKANLGEFEARCEIVEFALRQPLFEKLEALAAVQPKILGISVSIWNHTATIELLKKLKEKYLLSAPCSMFPVIVLGGPEVSHLPSDAEIFQYADYVIRGEGEIVFRELCEEILAGGKSNLLSAQKFIEAKDVDVSQIKSAYHLYTDEDVKRKLIYVESSRGCLFKCDFCLSSLCVSAPLREVNLEDFLSEVDLLITRGVKTFKFLDRTFNANIKRAIQICGFFLNKLSEQQAAGQPLFTVHFEIVPTLITPELMETMALFPPGSLRLEIGIQTLNPEVAARIGLPGRTDKTAEQILEPLRFLREKTDAIIHTDLIAGLPGETLESFGKGFDLLYNSMIFDDIRCKNFEIQCGILKQLPGAYITRYNSEFGMRYNPAPPYEVLETAAISAKDIARLKNFARFWEILVNRGLFEPQVQQEASIFCKFMELSDSLFTHFGRNWGIEKIELIAVSLDIWQKILYI